MTNLVETSDITRRFTESLILVEFRLGTFSNSKIDKEETKKTLDANQVKNRKVARVVKTLLPNCQSYKDIVSHDRDIWDIVNKYGAPYSKGVRMIAATSYMEFTAELRAALGKRDELIRLFASEYAANVQAAKSELKTLHKDTDYPDVSEIVSKFTHELSVTPVANPSDLRLAVLDEAAAAIQEAVNDSFKDRTESLAPYLRELLLGDPDKSGLLHLSAFLQTPDARWTESLFSNVLEAATKAKSLNILNDDQINNAVFEIHDKLDRPRESVKYDDQLRRIVLADCNTIIESLGGTVPPAYISKKSKTDDVENVLTDEQIDEAAQKGAEIFASLNWA